MKQQINLYKGSLRRERATFSAVAMSVGVGVCALGLTAGWFLASRHAQAIGHDLRVVQRQEAAAAGRLEELTRILASQDASDEESTSLNDALDALARRERLLELIAGPGSGATTGFSSPLRALAQHGVNGLWLTRVMVSAPAMRTTLEGRAKSPNLVPEYLLGLSAQGVLSGQRFDQFEIEQSEDDSDPTVRFSMTSEMAERFAREGAAP